LFKGNYCDKTYVYVNRCPRQDKMKVVSMYIDEQQLIRSAKANKREAQHKLYEKHAPKMLSVCRQYIKDIHQAEEAMCTGFFKAFTKINSYKGEGSFEGWIRRIMVRESISYLRSLKKIYFSNDGNLVPADTVNNIKSELEVSHIQQLIDNLPDGYRIVFIMYAIEGYKHKEIAKSLGISESTSKTQLFKARKQLQDALARENKLSYGTH